MSWPPEAPGCALHREDTGHDTCPFDGCARCDRLSDDELKVHANCSTDCTVYDCINPRACCAGPSRIGLGPQPDFWSCVFRAAWQLPTQLGEGS